MRYRMVNDSLESIIWSLSKILTPECVQYEYNIFRISDWWNDLFYILRNGKRITWSIMIADMINEKRKINYELNMWKLRIPIEFVLVFDWLLFWIDSNCKLFLFWIWFFVLVLKSVCSCVWFWFFQFFSDFGSGYSFS